MKNFLFYFLFFGILLSNLLAQTPDAGKTTNSSNGTISGRVLGDDGQPVSGAAVMVFEQGSGNLSTVTTDDEGVFRAEGLSAKTYTLRSRNSVFVEPVTSPDQLRFYRVGSNVTLNLIKGGVITGRVTDENGKPIVAMRVQAVRVRDEQGRKVNSTSENILTPRNTDDRGIYRLYGLLPGKYIVQTAGNTGGFLLNGMSNVLGENAPVYYPGVSRQAASEVSVATGDEVTGINIRFRADAGHTIRIKVLGGETDLNQTSGGGFMISNTVALEHFPIRGNAASDYSNPSEVTNEMVLRSVADGEYVAYAMRGNFWGESEGAGYISQRRRLTVKGADLNGITLTLAPLGSIAGKFETETIPEKDRPKTCSPSAALRLSEQVFHMRLTGLSTDQPASAWAYQIGSPNEKGEFKQRRLEAGNYRLTPNLSEENYFVKSIGFTTTAKSAAVPLNPNKTGLQLKAGENLKDVFVKMAEGAASVSGRLTAASNKLRIHLIPAEKDAGDDVLRYAEVVTNSGGTFRFSHVAPGSYWLLAKPIDSQISEELPASPIAWDAALRIKFRREAELNNQKIDLTLCQQLNDVTVKWNAVK